MRAVEDDDATLLDRRFDMPELDHHDLLSSKSLGEKRGEQKCASYKANIRSCSRRSSRKSEQVPSGRPRSSSTGRSIKSSSSKNGPSRRRSLSTGPPTGRKSSCSKTSSKTSSSTKTSSTRRVHKSLSVRSLSLHREGTDITDELQRLKSSALSPENIPMVSTQRRLKFVKAQGAGPVVTPEENDATQRDASRAKESQRSLSSQRGSRGTLLSPSVRQGSSSRLLSSQGRSPHLPSAQPQRGASCSRLLSPSTRQSSGSRLLSPSMRQGSSSRVLSSSMRNLMPPFPEAADDNSRRSSRPQSLRSIRALGINYHVDSGDTPESPIASPLSLSPRDGSFRGDVPTPSRKVQSLPKGLSPEESKETSTPISRRKTRQDKRIHLIANMLGLDVQSSPKLPVYDLLPMPLCEAFGGELPEDSDDVDIACDAMANFVQARLLDPAIKKKRLQVSLHQMGKSFKNKLSKPVKKYVKTRNQKTTNEWSLHQG